MRAAAPSLLILAAVISYAPRTGTESRTAVTPAPEPPVAAFIRQHCISCHNSSARVGGFSLSEVDATNIPQNAEVWEKVLHKIRTGQMPPAGRPRPDAQAVRHLTSFLETTIDAAAVRNPDPGRVAIHRLNRTEYANAIRDLLQLEVDTRALLLPDEADEGFDNVAASLALSPAHLERYLAAAREISRRAIGDRSFGDAPASAMYRVPRLLEQDVRTSDELPFGARGGIAVRHYFPLTGEYAFKVRLRRQVYDYIIGMGHPQQLDIRLDGKRLKRFTVGGAGTGTPGPLTWNGEIVGETSWELYMHAADAGLEVRTEVPAGEHLVSAAFVASPWEPEGVTQPLQVDFGRGSDEQYDGYAAVDALTVHGPYQSAGAGTTPSRRAIFICSPTRTADEASCARKIVTHIARRAYRRQPSGDEIQTLMSFYRTARRDRDFEAGIQAALERTLVSFNFLFRMESDQRPARAITAHRVSDTDLASRLSFFLWSSIPDDTLLDLAARGRLQDPAVLEQQARRMLRDDRSRALVSSFGSQWLGVRKAESALPDPNVFPEFDENLRRAFLQETMLFLDDQLRSDRPVVELLTADYSFLNDRLAHHYGVPGIVGERFRKVTFTDPARGGLLGQGSILLVTSYPDRTAPVLRGFWILDTLLGMPPPPPPPDIPDLEPRAADGRIISIREQMEVHRKNPVCAACHVRMDPLGFAMENFDAIGRWRMRSHGLPVDAAVIFADGTPIDGVRGLRTFLGTHRDNYVHTFVGKLLTYALGRHVDYRDQPAIRAIVREAARSDYRWSSIILGIVRSTPFQMRKTAS